jgi:hypothetical protein
VLAHRAVRGAVACAARDGDERVGGTGEPEREAPEERRERADVLGGERDGDERVEPQSRGRGGDEEARAAVEEGAVVRVAGDAVGVEREDLRWWCQRAGFEAGD